MGEEKVTKTINYQIKTGFIIGLISIFLSFIGIVPIIGMIFSIIGLVKYNSEKEKGLWMGIVGLVLNMLYILVNAVLYGYI